MKNDKRKLTARFEPEVRFEVQPVTVREFQTKELARLKQRMLEQRSPLVANPDQDSLVRLAAEDAASLAWETGQPLLFFPELFNEKSKVAFRRARQQRRVRGRTSGFFQEAA